MESEFVDPSKLPAFLRILLACVPERGKGLHQWLFKAARCLHAFLAREEIIALLEAITYGMQIGPGEIESAVDNSKKCAWIPNQSGNGQAHASEPWPAVDTEQREAIIRDGGGLAALREQSPVKFEADCDYAEPLIDALFPDNPLLCCGWSDWKFNTHTREEWRGHLGRLSLIVPSPMTGRLGLTQAGKMSAHALSITGERRFLVVEQDQGTIDEQATILWHLAESAPLTMAVNSGNKSVHGWFFCAGRGEYQLKLFMRAAVMLGADRATWTSNQFVRMPDGLRDNGQRQNVLYFNPETLP
jgi:hypothetical protein